MMITFDTEESGEVMLKPDGMESVVDCYKDKTTIRMMDGRTYVVKRPYWSVKNDIKSWEWNESQKKMRATGH